MIEKNIFGHGKYEGWGRMFSKLHKDLFFVLDDDWETPLNGDKSYYGSLIVDEGRFPSVKGLSPEQKLTSLSKSIEKFRLEGGRFMDMCARGAQI